jgi:PPM family protein phosphatase
MPLIESFGISDIGNRRKKNEDIFKILNEHNLFSVADGMGGHKAGDIAAKETVKQINNLLIRTVKYTDSIEQIIYHVKLAISETNQRIYNLSKSNIDFLGMGSTLCFLYLHISYAIFAHVGDSRIYHYNKNNLIQLTKDHSLINKLIEQKKVIKRSCKNVITKAIGTHPIIEPSIDKTSFEEGDIFLMTTDGLTDYISNDVIKKFIESYSDIQNLCENLINHAKNNGSCDNITTLAVKIIKK